MKKLSLALVLGLGIVPAFAYAQLGNVENIIESIGRIVELATPIVVGVALLVFFWGLVKFLMSADNEDKKADGRRLMIWGVIALFVMVSIVGLINFIGNSLDIDQGGSLPVPGVQG